jgi:tRNA(fMet)-specific endonuclease VapC
MKYLLDTDICINLIRYKPPEILRRFAALSVGDVGVSAITAAELQHGVNKSQHPEDNRRALEQFLIPLVVAPFDHVAAARYGIVRAALERQGTPIGALDTLIAAHALSLDVTLVSDNVREFGRVPGLSVVNWAVDE